MVCDCRERVRALLPLARGYLIINPAVRKICTPSQKLDKYSTRTYKRSSLSMWTISIISTSRKTMHCSALFLWKAKTPQTSWKGMTLWRKSNKICKGGTKSEVKETIRSGSERSFLQRFSVIHRHFDSRKGEVNPVLVTQKIRQGRKAVTLLTGFELFGLDAEELAEELRKLCSSSTTGRLTPHTIMHVLIHLWTSCASPGKVIRLRSDGPRETDESRHNTFNLERCSQQVDSRLWHAEREEEVMKT